MNEFTKSLIFAVVGSLLVGIATFVYFRSQPKEIDQFAMVGEEFFPEFDSPNDVRALEITAYDFDSRDVKQFRVEYRDKQWVIASHYGYPAEAADRLDRTAASVLGIQREALAGRRDSEHKRFGVVDPESEEADSVNRSDENAVGVRITLEDRNGEPLVDYIIGKEVDRQNEEDPMLREIRGLDPALPLHYVRVPGEKETYVASIQVDVSTKFADWIEPDLLLLDAQELRKLVINDYSFEEKIEEIEIAPGSGIMQQVRRLEKVEGQEYTLTKPAGFGPWTLEGLDTETEELDTAKISSLTRALDDFRIVGVAPRYKYQDHTILNAKLELEFPESIRTNDAAQQVVQEVAQDLAAKGFNLTQDRASGKLSIAADQGELAAATGEGLVYHLYFGNELTGTEREIELGTAAASPDSGEATSEGESSDESTSPANDESDESDKNRYVLVRVEFDETMLGEPPMQPVKPEPPSDDSAPAANKAEGGGQEAGAAAPNAGGEQPGSGGDDVNAGDGNTDTNSPDSKTGDNADKADDTKDDGKSAADSGDKQSGPFSPDADALVWGQDEKQDTASSTQESKQDEAKRQGDSQANGVSQDDASKSNQAAADDEKVQDEQVDPQAEYERQLEEYESAMASYRIALADYERRKAQSEEKVRLLNLRFQDWYYVISAENLEAMRISRSDLVKPKPKTEEEGDPMGGGNLPPSLNPLPLDGAPPQPPTQLPGNGADKGDGGQSSSP